MTLPPELWHILGLVGYVAVLGRHDGKAADARGVRATSGIQGWIYRRAIQRQASGRRAALQGDQQ